MHNKELSTLSHTNIFKISYLCNQKSLLELRVENEWAVQFLNTL